MIDIAMFEELARPIGTGLVRVGGPPPVMLESVFAKVVADGWVPRCPASEAELATLDRSFTQGDCLEPLIFAGDEVFIDRHMAPQPGDIVSFTLSSRGAARNSRSDRLCRPGDSWLKLYVPYAGIADMLLERFKHSATATLLACESPDEVPVLHPVRNIRRRGKLLFSPDHTCWELDPNAASTIGTILSSAASSITGPMPANSGVLLTQTQVSLTVNTTGFPVAIDASANAYYSLSSGTTLTALSLQVLRDGIAVPGGIWDFTGAGTYTITGGGNSAAQQITLSVGDSPPAGTHTYSLLLSVRGTNASTGGVGATTSQNWLKIREYKR